MEIISEPIRSIEICTKNTLLKIIFKCYRFLSTGTSKTCVYLWTIKVSEEFEPVKSEIIALTTPLGIYNPDWVVLTDVDGEAKLY